MIVSASARQVRAILGAMRQAASAAGSAPLTAADRTALGGAYRYVFKGAGTLDVDGLPAVAPRDLAALLDDPALAEHAVRFLAVMALVDGRVDEAKIAVVLDYARALGIVPSGEAPICRTLGLGAGPFELRAEWLAYVSR